MKRTRGKVFGILFNICLGGRHAPLNRRNLTQGRSRIGRQVNSSLDQLYFICQSHYVTPYQRVYYT